MMNKSIEEDKYKDGPNKQDMEKISEKINSILNVTKVNSKDLKNYSLQIKKNRNEIEMIKQSNTFNLNK